MPQLSGKVSQEQKERFQALRGESSFSEFIEKLLNSLENPQQSDNENSVSFDTHTGIIQEKDNEIGRLKTSVSLKNDEIQKQTQTISELETDVQGLKDKAPEVVQPAENQLLIEVNPFALFAIDDELAAEKKKNNKEYSRGELLVNSFLFMKYNGRVDACRLWSEREYNQYKKEYLTPVE